MLIRMQYRIQEGNGKRKRKSGLSRRWYYYFTIFSSCWQWSWGSFGRWCAPPKEVSWDSRSSTTCSMLLRTIGVRFGVSTWCCWVHPVRSQAELNGSSIRTRTVATIHFGTTWIWDCGIASRIGSQFGERYFFIQDEPVTFLDIVGVQTFVGPFHFFRAGKFDQDLIAIIQFHILSGNIEPLIELSFELSHSLVHTDHFFSDIVFFVTNFDLWVKVM